MTHAATTITTVEAALGTGNGIYMDLQSATVGFTNQGVTGVWSNWSNSWGFTSAGASTGDGGTANGPGDTSDSAITVFGRSADDKRATTIEIQVNYTGLSANTTYDLWAVLLHNSNTDKNPSHDFQWGETSGALTTIDSGPGYYNVATDITTGVTRLTGVKVGQVTTDGSGAITLYYDKGTNADRNGSNRYRTQFDGVLFDAVPEPSALALFGLAGLGFLRRRRK